MVRQTVTGTPASDQTPILLLGMTVIMIKARITTAAAVWRCAIVGSMCASAIEGPAGTNTTPLARPVRRWPCMTLRCSCSRWGAVRGCGAFWHGCESECGCDAISQSEHVSVWLCVRLPVQMSVLGLRMNHPPLCMPYSVKLIMCGRAQQGGLVCAHSWNCTAFMLESPQNCSLYEECLPDRMRVEPLEPFDCLSACMMAGAYALMSMCACLGAWRCEALDCLHSLTCVQPMKGSCPCTTAQAP